jgi:hypothetical protein
LQGKSRLVLLALVVLAACVAGCQQTINYPAPVIKSLSPASIQAGQPTFTLTVNGGNFTPASQVTWNGNALITFFGNTAVLTAQVPATLIQDAGTANIIVTTPQPGGGTTLTLMFTINPGPSPVPHISGLSPSGVTTGSAAFTMIVTGSNFVSTSVVTVNGDARTTGFVNSTSLQADILDSDVASAGPVQVAVVNPQPDGGSSNIFPLTVANPVPSISSLTPATAQAGSANTALVLTGTGYVPNSVILINGSPRTTAFGGATTLSASLTPADLAAAGITQIQVENPSPGGGLSNISPVAITPTLTAGLPVLVDVAVNGAPADAGVCGQNCAAGVPTLTTAGPSVSGTGQFVAFASTSSNLLSTATNGVSRVYVRNTCLAQSSCTPITLPISNTPSGITPNGPSYQPTIDSAADQGAYTSTATNLVNYAAVPNGTQQVYWTPVCPSNTTTSTPCAVSSSTGAASTTTAILVSLATDNLNAGNGNSYDPVISPDGQYVAFVSLATDLVTGVTVDGITPQVYIRTLCSGVTPLTETVGGCVPTTYLLSSPDGSTPGDGPSSQPSISNDGLFVSFVSTADNLGATAPNVGKVQEVFVRSTCVTTIGTSGNTCAPITNLISSVDGFTPANAPSGEPGISSDGRFIAFASTATNLGVPLAIAQQVYVRDTCVGVAVGTPPTCTQAVYLVSTPDGTTPANGLSETPSVSSCGTTTSTTGCTTTTTSSTAGIEIAFASEASNLAATQNGIENIFVRKTCLDLPTTTTTCDTATSLASLPAGSSPPQSNGSSVAPSISGDGHSVGFISSATNLVGYGESGFQDVFLGSTTF